ncbi:aminofutalosine synthase MqnE [Fundidesulfovibrio butyratiphilus]
MLDTALYDRHGLGDACRKVLAGERLSLADGLALYRSPGPHLAGALAHHARTRRHGDVTHYVLNRHVNPTNICVNDCLFCAYRRREGQEGAYVLTVEDALAKLTAFGHLDEVHIVGGCHPSLGLDYYLELCRRVRQAYPDASIKALTAVEVAHLADLAGMDESEALTALRQAGVDMMPGGGAEVFSPRVRAKVCPAKISGERWLSVMGKAHRAGLATNATMLFGHMETLEERLEHFDALRRQQDETGGFKCFIPLPYLPGANPLGESASGPTAQDALKTTALARLMLDNFDHIKAYWVMLGVKLAMLCLSYGADDLDGTVVEERIGHDAGSQSAQELSVAELEAAIRSCGFTPKRRDGLFREATEASHA